MFSGISISKGHVKLFVLIILNRRNVGGDAREMAISKPVSEIANCPQPSTNVDANALGQESALASNAVPLFCSCSAPAALNIPFMTTQ